MIIVNETSAAYTEDDGSFALNVRRIGHDDEYKPQWSYSVFAEGALVTSGTDLNGWSARGVLGALASFLANDGENYRHYMGEPEDGYLFGEDVAEWAYQVSDELSMAADDIENENEQD